MKSEVAYLREQIRLECEALQRVKNGYAVTSRHDFIDARTKNLETYQKALVPLIGEKAALETCCQTYIEVLG
jgi:hypothetical protein